MSIIIPSYIPFVKAIDLTLKGRKVREVIICEISCLID